MNWKSWKVKRIISLVLVLALMLALVPAMPVYGAGETTTFEVEDVSFTVTDVVAQYSFSNTFTTWGANDEEFENVEHLTFVFVLEGARLDLSGLPEQGIWGEAGRYTALGFHQGFFDGVYDFYTTNFPNVVDAEFGWWNVDELRGISTLGQHQYLEFSLSMSDDEAKRFTIVAVTQLAADRIATGTTPFVTVGTTDIGAVSESGNITNVQFLLVEWDITNVVGYVYEIAPTVNWRWDWEADEPEVIGSTVGTVATYTFFVREGAQISPESLSWIFFTYEIDNYVGLEFAEDFDASRLDGDSIEITFNPDAVSVRSSERALEVGYPNWWDFDDLQPLTLEAGQYLVLHADHFIEGIESVWRFIAVDDETAAIITGDALPADGTTQEPEEDEPGIFTLLSPGGLTITLDPAPVSYEWGIHEYQVLTINPGTTATITFDPELLGESVLGLQLGFRPVDDITGGLLWAYNRGMDDWDSNNETLSFVIEDPWRLFWFTTGEDFDHGVSFIFAFADDIPEEPTPTPQPTGLDSASSWAREAITQAIELGLVPQSLQSNYTQAATRAEFAALAVALYETVTGREITQRMEFNDTTDINVQKMGALGVVNGVGGGYFAPNRTITREQAAVMLARLTEVIGHSLEAVAPAFADNANISSWATQAVGQMYTAGIMGDTGNNMFSPGGDCTREQSIVMFLRLFNLLQ